jgi:ParB family transcriptional regulator, chromosome partitioning protein
MARKQSDYLNALLSDDDEAVAAPALEAAARPATTLLARESALARIASGEVRQVTQLLLDPARVRIWAGNARHYAGLTEENCRDLIDSILAEGGQRVPAVVRRVEGDPAYEYEVIAGTRRHFSVSWLRANSYPQFTFLAQVQPLDDEAAFRLADLENRARRDVTDLERARNYLEACERYYGGHQSRMAERLKVSKGWLSKLLSVARLPEDVVAAFASPADIQLKPVYPVAQAYELSRTNATAITKEARAIHAERAGGKPALAAAEVIRRLLAATRRPVAKEGPYQHFSRYGRAVLTVRNAGRQGVTIELHNGSGASEEEAIEAVRNTLRVLGAQGRGYQQ